MFLVFPTNYSFPHGTIIGAFCYYYYYYCEQQSYDYIEYYQDEWSMMPGGDASILYVISAHSIT